MPNISYDNGNYGIVFCDKDNRICRLYYSWSKNIFHNAAITLELTAEKLMQNEIVKNNKELATQIWDAFGELYKAIKKVDDELVLAIHRKETEPIEAPVSLIERKDLSTEDSNAVVILEKLWSEIKLIMEQAINKMESNSQWHDLLENLIKDGERISSELLSLLRKNI